MNTHPSLERLLSCETTAPNPRQSAKSIGDKAQAGQTHAVLFADRNRIKWLVVLIPCEGYPNLAQCSRKRFNGLPAVASAPITPASA